MQIGIKLNCAGKYCIKKYMRGRFFILVSCFNGVVFHSSAPNCKLGLKNEHQDLLKILFLTRVSNFLQSLSGLNVSNSWPGSRDQIASGNNESIIFFLIWPAVHALAQLRFQGSLYAENLGAGFAPLQFQ